ncbi:Initiation-specific alpha-1,6-mannosyltransferase [Lachnellula suecica]|uniref:Initiation-specific alpha-1,6-mannosyltransferase n=1 Tax=Lachnellula suecica TaxID=602035 RepID=A0A8T9C4E9_9HELO|nr:Initiation-specific alpha-1,6-mannosyltransferase [Lachnellula suecica]
MLISFHRSLMLKSLRFVLPASFCLALLFLNRAWILNDQTLFQQSSKSSTVRVTSPAATIPKKLWYKLGPNGLNSELQGYVNTCLSKNPEFHHEFLTDLSGDAFVKEHFASRPDIVETFLALRIPIVKADILRYLILYEKGGTWNDLDITCEDVPIREWIPAQYKESTGLLVGLEFDVDIWVRQFASWTIMAKPKSPHILMVVDDCLEAVREKTREHNVGVDGLQVSMIGDIVDFSGPRRLTRGVLKSLSLILNQKVDNDNISAVSEPRLIGDVLVMPDYSFANSMNEQFGDSGKGQRLVTHHYAGSWKNDHGGQELSNSVSLVPSSP